MTNTNYPKQTDTMEGKKIIKMGICPECTADAFITQTKGKRLINCGYCGKFEMKDNDWNYQKDVVKNLTGVTI
jgi:ribosomal protein S27AE